MERIYREERFPDWHFNSFSRCAQFLRESLEEAENLKAESDRPPDKNDKSLGITKTLHDYDHSIIKSCLYEQSLRAKNSYCNFFSSDSIGACEIDERTGNHDFEQIFASFCTVMRDRSGRPLLFHEVGIILKFLCSNFPGSRELRFLPGRETPEALRRWRGCTPGVPNNNFDIVSISGFMRRN